MHVYFLMHHPDHGPARFCDWLTGMGHSFNTCRLYEDEIPPNPGNFDALIVLDGPDSALDPTPYLHIKRERKLIQRVLSSAKPLLGIGYGGSLIAQQMGAVVSGGSLPELGWQSISKAPGCTLPLPDKFEAFCWHQEIFGIPPDADAIGSTRVAPVQGFSWDSERVIAMQFHLEATTTSARAISETALECVGAEDEDGYLPDHEDMFAANRRFDRLAPLLDRVMLSWLGLG